jgi:cysteine desulfurase/selenocysteine lyase
MPGTAPPRRYLDNAATTWPKPPQVLDASLHAARAVGATAGRAAYREAVEADAIRGRARAAVARLLGDVDPSRVALPGGCTLALNMAIHSLLGRGGHAIATAADHNATLRPLHWLARSGVIELTIVPCDGQGRVEPEEIAAAWRNDTRLVAVSQVSNVTGVAQPMAEIAAVAHERCGLVVVDAAQALGQVECRVAELGADVVAAAGHKWLLGTGGAGLLWVRPGLDLEPLVQGGTGSASDSLDMPEAFTDRMEAGTPDVPGLAALAAGIAWLEEQGLAAVGTRCRGLASACAARLAAIRGVRVIGVPDGGPIVSFTVEGYDPSDVAVLVEQIAGVQVRSGHHCAARIHEHLGTAAGGTVRASFGPFNTEDDASALVGAIETITGGA